MIASGFAFTVMVSMVKVARADMDPISVMFWRSLVAMPVALLWARGHLQRLSVNVAWPMAFRCIFGFSAMFCFYYASAGLGIAELSFLSKLQPIALALLAPLLLGRDEKVAPRLWLVLGISFLGVVVMLGPGLGQQSSWSSMLSGYGAVAIVASVCSAVAHLCVRRLGEHLNAPSVVFYFQAAVFVLTIVVLSATSSWIVPAWSMLPLLLGIGISSTVGQLCMTRAYALAPAAKVAVFSYVSPLWGILADALLFVAWPEASVWLGGALIFAGGILLLTSGHEKKSHEAQPSS